MQVKVLVAIALLMFSSSALAGKFEAVPEEETPPKGRQICKDKRISGIQVQVFGVGIYAFKVDPDYCADKPDTHLPGFQEVPPEKSTPTPLPEGKSA